MGVSISAKNASYSFDMGGGGFFNLRKNIAYALDNDFGEVYAQIIKCYTSEECRDNGQVTTRTDRQIFRQSLHDSKNQSLYPIHILI